jgi:glycosyltransferase involved in cell wall biosynthesis
LPIPVLGLRVFRKKTLVLVGGTPYLSIPANKRYLRYITFLLEDIQYYFSNAILVVSKELAKFNPLPKYKGKIFETPVVIFDDVFLKKFRFSSPAKRKHIVGFIGRFSWEKGILEFVNSLPLIASRSAEVSFLIIGDGPLRDTMIERLNTLRINKSVKLMPWVMDVEKYLAEIKLLVIPSATEGLPSVMLEAIASGTPVLAAPVGAIPQVIKEGCTGFLLRSNNPKVIADRVCEIIDNLGLMEKVSINAYNYVQGVFSSAATLKCWQDAFMEV